MGEKKKSIIKKETNLTPSSGNIYDPQKVCPQLRCPKISPVFSKALGALFVRTVTFQKA